MGVRWAGQGGMKSNQYETFTKIQNGEGGVPYFPTTQM